MAGRASKGASVVPQLPRRANTRLATKDRARPTGGRRAHTSRRERGDGADPVRSYDVRAWHLRHSTVRFGVVLSVSSWLTWWTSSGTPPVPQWAHILDLDRSHR